MRDWNAFAPARVFAVSWFWSYLWGIEMRFARAWCGVGQRFWSYLWGIEMRKNIMGIRGYVWVLILPMRDWNTPLPTYGPIRASPFWSYLWGIEISNGWQGKRLETTFWSYLWGIEMCELCWNSSMTASMFWSYLWGIEILIILAKNNTNIRFDLTYEGLKFLPSFARQSLPNEFWSYLWGIEICNF